MSKTEMGLLKRKKNLTEALEDFRKIGNFNVQIILKYERQLKEVCDILENINNKRRSKHGKGKKS